MHGLWCRQSTFLYMCSFASVQYVDHWRRGALKCIDPYMHDQPYYLERRTLRKAGWDVPVRIPAHPRDGTFISSEKFGIWYILYLKMLHRLLWHQASKLRYISYIDIHTSSNIVCMCGWGQDFLLFMFSGGDWIVVKCQFGTTS